MTSTEFRTDGDRHELSELLGCEQRVAYEVLRITLHTVRNAKFGNDLPPLLRGLYLEAWDPMKTHGHDDLRDLATSLLAALPLTAASDRDMFAKIFTFVLNPTRSQEIDQARPSAKALRHVCPKQ